jgi:glycosyltransferase involved in cell wall biosynthesis
LAKRTRESFLSHFPIQVIQNGIDLELYKPGRKTSEYNNINIDQDTFLILAILKSGRKGKYKDREMLERVINRIKHYDFGKEVTIMIVNARKPFDGKIGNKRIIKFPFLNDDTLIKMYQACDLFINTADAETFGLTACEAMACGAPVVSTNAGGLPELVRDGKNGFVVPVGDDEAMAKQIGLLMQYPEKYKEMGVCSREIVEKEYGINRMVDRYLKLYKMMITEKTL